MPRGNEVRPPRPTYLNIADGVFKENVQEGEDGPEREETFGSLTGHLYGLDFRDGKYGEELLVYVHDGKELFQVQMRVKSGYGKAFMKMARNIDPLQPMTLIPSLKNSEDPKEGSSLDITQGGGSVRWHYTRKNPDGMPEWDKTKSSPEEQQAAQIAFLKERMMELQQTKLADVPVMLPPADIAAGRLPEVAMRNLPPADHEVPGGDRAGYGQPALTGQPSASMPPPDLKIRGPQPSARGEAPLGADNSLDALDKYEGVSDDDIV